MDGGGTPIRNQYRNRYCLPFWEGRGGSNNNVAAFCCVDLCAFVCVGQEQKEREVELHSPSHIDVDRKISFWAKFLELQVSDTDMKKKISVGISLLRSCFSLKKLRAKKSNILFLLKD